MIYEIQFIFEKAQQIELSGYYPIYLLIFVVSVSYFKKMQQNLSCFIIRMFKNQFFFENYWKIVDSNILFIFVVTFCDFFAI